jgi:hypothetical protein
MVAKMGIVSESLNNVLVGMLTIVIMIIFICVMVYLLWHGFTEWHWGEFLLKNVF